MQKKKKLDPYLPKLHSQKLTQNRLKMNIRPETMKLLEENMEIKILDIGLAMSFLDLTPKAKAKNAKINRWSHIKLKSFYAAKEAINKVKR